MFQLDQIVDVRVSPSTNLKLVSRGIIFEVFPTYVMTSRTDRRTDGQWHNLRSIARYNIWLTVMQLSTRWAIWWVTCRASVTWMLMRWMTRRNRPTRHCVRSSPLLQISSVIAHAPASTLLSVTFFILFTVFANVLHITTVTVKHVIFNRRFGFATQNSQTRFEIHLS